MGDDAEKLKVCHLYCMTEAMCMYCSSGRSLGEGDKKWGKGCV